MKKTDFVLYKMLRFFLTALLFILFCFLFAAVIVTPLWLFATKAPTLFSFVFLGIFLFLIFIGLYSRVQKKR